MAVLQKSKEVKSIPANSLVRVLENGELIKVINN